jgi:hypothetical protein
LSHPIGYKYSKTRQYSRLVALFVVIYFIILTVITIFVVLLLAFAFVIIAILFPSVRHFLVAIIFLILLIVWDTGGFRKLMFGDKVAGSKVNT